MAARILIPGFFSYKLTGHSWSARADRLQSLTGVLLGCFLIAHLHFESSILLGKDAFYHVVQILEGGIFSETGHGFPVVTKVFSVLMLVVVMLHAGVALRRFPVQLGQWRALRTHLSGIQHKDTHAWFWQMVSGFILFFLVPAHLFTMILNPEIGPHLSAARVFHDNAWLLYALLLPAVVVHAMIGLYRVAIKWGVISQRRTLRKVMKCLIIYLCCVGLASLVSYMLIGESLILPFEPYRP